MNWNRTDHKKLIKAFLILKTSAEAQRFLRDLMTQDEIEEFARRFRAAEMLFKNIPYVCIAKETSLSSTTIARVSKWLNRPKSGYKTVISKLRHQHSSSQIRKGILSAH